MTASTDRLSIEGQFQRGWTPRRATLDAAGWRHHLGALAVACLTLVGSAGCGGSSTPGDAAGRQNSIAPPALNSVRPFAVLAGQTVTNTGPTEVVGDLGVSPGTSVTGFPPGLVSGGVQHAADAVALQAQHDLGLSYDDLAGRPCGLDASGVDLAGRTLSPGVYCFSSSALLSGDLVLDAQGSADAVFIFQIGSTLITSSSATVRMINGGQSCNVFWQVGSSATLGTGTSFIGSILALTSIDLATGATLAGRALARNGAVTLDSNQVRPGTCGSCAGQLCGTACVDTGTDPANCGACGSACGTGAACVAGVCSAPPPPPVCRDLGPARSFDVFTLEGFTTTGGAVQGAMGVGGDFLANDFSIGQGLAPGSVALIVGGDVRYHVGAVNGDVIIGGTLCWICDVVVSGTVSAGKLIDFAEASTALLADSASLTALPANGTATLTGTTLLLVGGDPALNVFSVPVALLSGARRVELRVPAGSHVLVNVVGAGPALLRDLVWDAGGLPAGRTLLNFDQATEVRLQGLTLEASVLAPRAAVVLDAAVVTGQIVARSLDGTAQVNSAPFDTCAAAP